MAMLTVDHFPLLFSPGTLPSWSARGQQCREKRSLVSPDPASSSSSSAAFPGLRLRPCRNFSPQDDSKQLGKRWSGATPASSVHD